MTWRALSISPYTLGKNATMKAKRKSYRNPVVRLRHSFPDCLLIAYPRCGRSDNARNITHSIIKPHLLS